MYRDAIAAIPLNTRVKLRPPGMWVTHGEFNERFFADEKQEAILMAHHGNEEPTVQFLHLTDEVHLSYHMLQYLIDGQWKTFEQVLALGKGNEGDHGI